MKRRIVVSVLIVFLAVLCLVSLMMAQEVVPQEENYIVFTLTTSSESGVILPGNEVTMTVNFTSSSTPGNTSLRMTVLSGFAIRSCQTEFPGEGDCTVTSESEVILSTTDPFGDLSTTEGQLFSVLLEAQPVNQRIISQVGLLPKDPPFLWRDDFGRSYDRVEMSGMRLAVGLLELFLPALLRAN